MSYVLHVWEGPTPDSADDVAELIHAKDSGLAPSLRFPEFAAALSKKYPDAHTLEANGKDPERAVWSDSPLDGQTTSPFLVLGLRIDHADRKLMHFLVKTAGAHGLHVYDMQTGELWRKDDPPPAERVKPPRPAKPVRSIGQLRSFLNVPLWDLDRFPRPTPEPGERIDVDAAEANRIVFGPVAQHVAQYGWTVEPWPADPALFLSRRVGPAKQLMRLHVYDVDGTWGTTRPTGAIERYGVSISFLLDIPSVQESLYQIHPRWRKKREKERAKEGPRAADLWLASKDLFAADEWVYLHFKPISSTDAAPLLTSRRDMQWWSELFRAWYDSQAEPPLAACTDLTTLNRIVNNPYRFFYGAGESDWELMTTLALARMAPHPDVPWEECVAAARYRADRLALDEALIERTIAALAPKASA